MMYGKRNKESQPNECKQNQNTQDALVPFNPKICCKKLPIMVFGYFQYILTMNSKSICAHCHIRLQWDI